MQRNELLAGLKEILVPFIGVEKEKLNSATETTDLAKDLGVKSTDVINVVLEIEKKWGISFEDEEIDSLQELTIKSIIDLILTKNP
jgi:acyl carrier protein